MINRSGRIAIRPDRELVYRAICLGRYQVDGQDFSGGT